MPAPRVSGRTIEAIAYKLLPPTPSSTFRRTAQKIQAEGTESTFVKMGEQACSKRTDAPGPPFGDLRLLSPEQSKMTRRSIIAR
jgi:hypothetical protein